VDVVTNVDGGYPAAGILEYADANDVDCIAMGTAGRTGINRFLLGSTTERVIRHADVPVLAVNARGGARTDRVDVGGCSHYSRRPDPAGRECPSPATRNDHDAAPDQQPRRRAYRLLGNRNEDAHVEADDQERAHDVEDEVECRVARRP